LYHYEDQSGDCCIKGSSTESCRRIVVIEHSIAYCGIITGIVIGVLLYHEIMIDIAVWEECSSIADCCISRVSEMEDCCIKSVLA
jgi:hypothetical protein